MIDRTDAETVIYRLNEAGRTLLALPGSGCLPADFKAAWPEVVHLAVEAYGYGNIEVRYPTPEAAAITRMDETWRWMIHVDSIALRRILLLRSLNHPLTHRERYSWRKIAHMLGCDYRAVQGWYSKGIDKMVAGINGGSQKSMLHSVQKPRIDFLASENRARRVA